MSKDMQHQAGLGQLLGHQQMSSSSVGRNVEEITRKKSKNK